MKERTAITLIMSLAILLAVKLAVSVFSPPNRIRSTEFFWLNKANCRPQYDIVLIGDSRVGSGLSPGTMQKELKNLKVLNFAFQGINFTDILDETEKKLRPESPCKVICMGITPHALLKSPFTGELFGKYRNSKLKYRLYSIYEFFLIPSFESPDKKKIPIFYHADGWFARPASKQNQKPELERYSKRFEENKVSPEIIEKILRKTSEWKSGGIRVFGFRPPVTDEMLRLENEKSGFDEKEFVKEFRKAGGVWLEFENRNYFCFDGSHINRESAIKFSHNLAKKIKEDFEKNK